MEATRLNFYRFSFALVLLLCVVFAQGVSQAHATEVESPALGTEQEVNLSSADVSSGQEPQTETLQSAPSVQEEAPANNLNNQSIKEDAVQVVEDVLANTVVTDALADVPEDQRADAGESALEPEEGLSAQASTGYDSSHVNMYRLYNPNSGEHFYTSDIDEATSVASVGWRWEDVGWVAPITSSNPVFRLYNPNAGDHHYTLSSAERDDLVSLGWSYEGIGWYSDSADQLAVLRQYNPNAITGSHNFTLSAEEDRNLGSAGWSQEGTAWYATNGPTVTIVGRWLVTAAWGTVERYWIDSTGSIAHSRFVEEWEGAGYNAYATDSGAVVRGKFDAGNGYVIVADNEGRLAATADGADGWLVTDAYDGVMQRYYYSAAKRAMHSGFFNMDGAKYFGIGGQGFVLRGKMTWGDHVLLADNDGRLATGEGWMTSDLYDNETKTYFLEHVWADFSGARVGIFKEDGRYYFGVSGEGYVVDSKATAWVDGWWYMLQDGNLVDVAPEIHARVNRFVELMKAMAADNSHGYDQAHRWGEYGDYDCSSLVIHCLREAGFDTGDATYTGNMRSNLVENGWEWRTSIGAEEKHAGVVLLSEKHHTAAMISTTQLAQASINENGGITGGQPGDQTGKEMLVRDYYDYPWDGVLIPTPWVRLA